MDATETIMSDLMGSSTIISYTMDTYVYHTGTVKSTLKQKVELSDETRIRELENWTMKTQEAHVRQGLIEMGWKPPVWLVTDKPPKNQAGLDPNGPPLIVA